MAPQKYTIEVGGKREDGVDVFIKAELDEVKDIAKTVDILSAELNKSIGTANAVSRMQQTTVVAPVATLKQVTPSPTPKLMNAPHQYRPGDAVLEILDPDNNAWASQPRTVKEIQDVLISLGVRGVSNLQTFDSVMRSLLRQGKVRREGTDGTYVYYLVK